jgi:hypothetical protein
MTLPDGNVIAPQAKRSTSSWTDHRRKEIIVIAASGRVFRQRTDLA